MAPLGQGARIDTSCLAARNWFCGSAVAHVMSIGLIRRGPVAKHVEDVSQHYVYGAYGLDMRTGDVRHGRLWALDGRYVEHYHDGFGR